MTLFIYSIGVLMCIWPLAYLWVRRKRPKETLSYSFLENFLFLFPVAAFRKKAAHSPNMKEHFKRLNILLIITIIYIAVPSTYIALVKRQAAKNKALAEDWQSHKGR
jgi:hypothetical protein